MRKVERNSKVSNAPIAAQRPTLIHRFVRSLKRRCIYLLFSVSRRRKCGVNFPRLQEKGCVCRGKGASAYRSQHSPVRYFFFIRPVLTQSFYFPRRLNVDICLAGSERLDEKYSDRRIIYRMCNLNNPRSLGYRAIRIALPSVIARSTFFTNCKNMNNARGRFLRDKLFLQDRQRFGIKKQHLSLLF